MPFWVGLNFNYIHISPVYGWVNCEGGGARAAARRVAPRQHLALAGGRIVLCVIFVCAPPRLGTPALSPQTLNARSFLFHAKLYTLYYVQSKTLIGFAGATTALI